jgi:hypothetical protein
VGFAFYSSGFCSRFALCEAVGRIARLDDTAMVRDAIKQRSGHLGIPKDRYPLAELEVGRDDDTGGFIQLADPLVGRRMHAFAEKQVKQQRPAGLWKWDIAELVDDDAIHGRQLSDDLPGATFGLLRDQGIDQIDSVIEAHPLAPIDQTGPEGDGNVRLASAGSSDKNDVMGVISELA